MSQLRKLAGQTAIYGLSSIVGRLLNYLLVPLYTRIFSPEEYGVVSEFYAWITFIMVIYSLGMETALFHFSNRKTRYEHVYEHALAWSGGVTLICTFALLLFSESMASWLGYPGQAMYIRCMALIMAFDALSTLPFARLRQHNKALRFVYIKLTGIFTNIGLNLIFFLLLPGLGPSLIGIPLGVGYVFLANLIASFITLVLLLPELRPASFRFNSALSKEMLVYALPLLVAGFAGMVNETLDRAILKYLVNDKDEALHQLGVYSACYKLSILMTLFVQTFRYAADPFYFSQQHKKDSYKLFAGVMNYFVMAGCIIFLGVMFYMDIFKYFIGKPYHEGLDVVPVLLFANLFLGIYLNMSIWYKLSGQTGFGAWLSVIGAVITIAFNLWLIPEMGFRGAAWATFICYFSMMVLSYLKGRQVLPIPYQTAKLIGMLLSATALWLCMEWLRRIGDWSEALSMLINTAALLLYFGALWKWIAGKSPVSIHDFLKKK